MSQTNAATLITKVLVPRRRDDVVSRARLLDLLYDMSDHRLVLVTAPAGFGKTTLLVDFAADLEHPVCWYSLDATDRDPRLFLERLILSLQRRFAGVGEATARALEAGADLRDGAPSIVRMLVNEIVARVPQWFVLVLDDYHVLGQAPEIGAIVSNFVAYQRDQCMTIIASRSVPELPLIISFVARGGVGGLGQIEVRFEPDEVRMLFAQNYATELSLPEARTLADRFEGWVTGLILTAHVRQPGVLQQWLLGPRQRDEDVGRPAEYGERGGGADQLVYDYLAHEVFERQPPEMQRFLLRSSVLEEMSPTLCREVLAVPDADRFLDSLETENLFVTRLEEEVQGEVWRRYHHLFREFLQGRFRREDETAWAALHLATARWFEAAGQVREAIGYYLTGGCSGEAGRLMEAAAQDLFRRGQLTTLLGWREELPEAVLAQIPRLTLFQARAASKLGEPAVAMRLAEAAEASFTAAGLREGAIYALLERSEILLSQGKSAEALALGEEALAQVAHAGVPLGYAAHRIVGLAQIAVGEVAAGRSHLEAALALSLSQGADYDRALVCTGLAYCLGLQGELERAIAVHREALALWRSLSNEACLMDELSDLAFHLYALGRYEEAVTCFQEALTLCRRLGARRGEAYVLVSLGELARDVGALEPAAAYCERGRVLAQEAGISFLVGYSHEALGLVHRAAGRWGEAVEELQRAVRASDGASDYPAGRYLASLGVVHAERGAHTEGLRDLDTAVTRLEKAGLPTELYRARLFRAWGAYLSSDEGAAVAALGRVLAETPPGAGALSLEAEAGRMAPMFEAAMRVWEGLGRQGDLSAAAWASRLRAIQDRGREMPALGKGFFPPGQEALAAGPARGPVDAAAIRIYGSGAGRVEVGGETISAAAWGAVTARYLLFYLLVLGARTREQIADDLWPELPAPKAKAAFHTAKFRLNRALGCEAIAHDGTLYSLRDDLPVWFDVRVFRSELAAWRRTQDPDHARQALALYLGDFLPDCYMDWCVEEREVLRARCLETLEALAVRLLARRQYRRAVETLQQALGFDPAREAFHVQLMKAYVFLGERSRALAQYQRCAAALEVHLAARPSAETVRLYDRIMREAPLE